jgi:tetratricopeptide (TPR) repeat protein
VKRLTRPIITIYSLILAAFGTSALAAGTTTQTAPAKKYPYSIVDGACTDSENWEFTPRLPKVWQKKFLSMLAKDKDPGTSVDVMMQAGNLRLTVKSTEIQFVAEYWIWRTLYDLKMVHLASRGFSSMIARATTPETQSMRWAALDCINVIHKAYPSISLQPSTVEYFKTLNMAAVPPNKREKFWLAVSDYLRFRISDRAPDAEIEAVLPFLRGSGAYEAWVLVSLNARKANEAEVIKSAGPLVNNRPLPKGLQPQADEIHLTLARAYYGLGLYDRAIAEYKLVKNTSNLFTQALNEQAWSHLLKHRYSEAVSTAQNLLVGGLRGTFEPEANSIIAISYNETCNFPEAVESMKYFGRRYQKIYKWLYDWNARSKTDSDLYGMVAQYLQKKSSMPDRVATELIRSPVFIARQAELNALIDGKGYQASLLREIAKRTAGKRAATWKRTGDDVTRLIAGLSNGLEQREAQLVTEINEDLTERAHNMLTTLNDVSSNMQLVEAEVYNSFGERIIMDNAGVGPKGAPSKEKKRDDSGTWDWGRFPAADDDDAEIWEDELGFLKTEIKNKCPTP